MSCSGTSRHLARQSPGIEPATFWLPDNRSYLLSYCCPKAKTFVKYNLVRKYTINLSSGTSCFSELLHGQIDWCDFLLAVSLSSWY